MTVTRQVEQCGGPPWLPEDTIELTPREAQDLKILSAYVGADATADPESFCREAKRAAEKLPRRIKESLWDFARWGTASGVIVISGVPLGDIPPTPLDNTEHVGERTLLARVQAMFNETLGNMIGYEAEGGGRMFQDMAPSPLAARLQTSLSSEVELELHTEQAFSELRPDYLSLACLRGDPKASTYVFTARDIAMLCGDRLSDLLRQPLWFTDVDESFRSAESAFVHGDTRGPMPILSGAQDDPFVVFDQDLMRGVNQQAQEALETVIGLYPRHRASVVLNPGEILILDNHRAVHGRSPFEPRFDGTDRFIVRSFVVTDLVKSRHARGGDSRVVVGRFS